MARILLISALRDEGPHLLEWLAHHRAIGVTDFLLFSNDCSDGTDKLLDALAPAGVAHVRNQPPPNKSIQWNALKLAWKHDLRKAADWILAIDCDEFVNLRAPLDTLDDLLGKVGVTDAVVLPWRLFGWNGERCLRQGLTTELFSRAAPEGCDYPADGRQFKTLFRSRGPFARLGVHRPRTRKGQSAAWVDGSGHVLPDWFAQNEQKITLFGLKPASDLVQLNHYSLRSAQSFLLKRARGLPNRKHKPIDLMYWVERNFNSVEDHSINRLVPGTKAVLSELMQIPRVAELHAAAAAWHHARFDELMRDEAELKLYGRLLLAADSTPLEGAVVTDLIRRYQAANV
ncbi:glycosyltransferase family 2 protein [Pseudoruegeria sp. HB172150]|uniref:glycosyltransferase family 2 protein n=1 Tax=Pseudoruegeria sp. HB172150 TaxID=2721164 RepID=UPI0020A6CEB9|nr:glycosyltransferase family 2 protein [Pseudoruegeria sp. HB172150]